MDPIELSVFDCNIRIECPDDYARSLLVANYGWFQMQSKEPQLRYFINRERASQEFMITRDDVEPLLASDDGEFLFQFEKDMTIQLQKLRRELYFLHAAALEFAGRSFLLVAASGGGKSTTAWGLLHQGFRYLSDELAPVSLESMEVQPYPHAICLKKEPPKPYFLPDRTVYTSKTMHVPTKFLPSEVGRGPTPLLAIFFLQGPRSSAPGIKLISKAEAAARLFANALNPLAHAGEGLDGAIEIVRRKPCFELTIADPSATVALVNNTVQSLFDETQGLD
jgi:hypothetical protein